jgi:hypothetical protein
MWPARRRATCLTAAWPRATPTTCASGQGRSSRVREKGGQVPRQQPLPAWPVGAGPASQPAWPVGLTTWHAQLPACLPACLRGLEVLTPAAQPVPGRGAASSRPAGRPDACPRPVAPACPRLAPRAPPHASPRAPLLPLPRPPGLDEGLLTMKVGGVRRLFVPGPLAFPKGLPAGPGRWARARCRLPTRCASERAAPGCRRPRCIGVRFGTHAAAAGPARCIQPACPRSTSRSQSWGPARAARPRLRPPCNARGPPTPHATPARTHPHTRPAGRAWPPPPRLCLTWSCCRCRAWMKRSERVEEARRGEARRGEERGGGGAAWSKSPARARRQPGGSGGCRRAGAVFVVLVARRAPARRAGRVDVSSRH